MNLKIFTIVSLLAFSATAVCQTETDINKNRSAGEKAGSLDKENIPMEIFCMKVLLRTTILLVSSKDFMTIKI